MTVLNGKSVCGSAICGNVCMIDKPILSAERVGIIDTAAELDRVRAARRIAEAQLQEIYDRALDKYGESNAQIFGIHLMMLEDEDYNGSIDGMIEAECVNAEYAVSRTSEMFSQMLEAMDNEYMRARSADVRDVSYRLLSILKGAQTDLPPVPENSVIFADDLTPSQAVALDSKKPAAFVTAHGSPISHTAILARSMNIPVVIGVGDELLKFAKNGERVLVDGKTGEVILNPDRKAFTRLYREKPAKAGIYHPLSGETVTLDGTRITLAAEITVDEDIPAHADGISVLSCPKLDAAGQFEYYRSIAEKANGGRVFLRLPDIKAAAEQRDKDILRQMKSAFRAFADGCAWILFPMISCVAEARKLMKQADGVINELRGEGCVLSGAMKLGFMLETPAAAIISDTLAPMCDFFMIDSDRLSRHMLAAGVEIFDAEYAESQKSAVMRLISHSARSAVKNGAGIGLCGSFAGDPALTEEFLRMGIDKLCVPPNKFEEIRQIVKGAKLDR